jgi:hypothetical protein
MVMSPTEIGPENDCAGEANSNCKRHLRPRRVREPRGIGTSAVESRYQATAREY